MAQARSERDSEAGSEEGSQSTLHLLAHAVAGLTSQLGKKAALFVHGPVAARLAETVQALPSRPPLLGGAGGGTAAVVLLDRSVAVGAALQPPVAALALAAACGGEQGLGGWPVDGGPGFHAWWRAAATGGLEATSAALQDGWRGCFGDEGAPISEESMATVTESLKSGARHCCACRKFTQPSQIVGDASPQIAGWCPDMSSPCVREPSLSAPAADEPLRQTTLNAWLRAGGIERTLFAPRLCKNGIVA
jgi:hypothetical protein